MERFEQAVVAAHRLIGAIGITEELDDVVEHYNDLRKLELTSAQRKDLVEYLKTL